MLPRLEYWAAPSASTKVIPATSDQAASALRVAAIWAASNLVKLMMPWPAI
jgi:hypothetical protein